MSIGPNDPTVPIPETEIRVPPMDSGERREFLALLRTLVGDVRDVKGRLDVIDQWMRGGEAAGGVFDTLRKHDSQIKEVRRVVIEHIDDHKQHATESWDWIRAALLGAVGILVMVVIGLVAFRGAP